MSSAAYLIFHKDHPLHVQGLNSGAEMATLQLARYLVRAGHRVVVCGELPAGECEHDGVAYWDFGENFEVEHLLDRAKSLGQYHLISAGRALPIMQSRGRNECLTRSFISHDPVGQAAGINNQSLSRICDGIICVSNAQKDLMVRSGVDPAKVHVIYNGVDLDLFKAGPSSERDFNKLIFVGALVPDKGAHVLIEAFAQLKLRHPALTLDVYGSSKLWNREPYLDEAGLARQIPGLTFRGAKDQQHIAVALQRAGISVSPSIWFEALGLASIEAQSTGCPVVAFDVGGLKETMTLGETGILVSEISANALQGGIETLLGNPMLHKQMCENAARITRARFSWEKCAEEMVALCEGYSRQDSAPATMITAKKVGFMTTWNQQCGLATYCKYLTSTLEAGSYVIFGEKRESGLTATDEPFVERVWQRDSSDLSVLEAAIHRHDIGLLHLNFHDHKFYASPSLNDLVGRLRRQGIKVVSHMHTTFTLDAGMHVFGDMLDGVIVHTPENRLQVVAQGVDPAKIWVLPHGVHECQRPSAEDRLRLRAKLKIAENEHIILSVGFVQPDKGMEAVIEAVSHLTEQGMPARGLILGKVIDKPQALECYQQLKKLASVLGVGDRITFEDRFFADDEVRDYLVAADLVMMNYHRKYYEASGACSLAIGAGALVVASLAPQFQPFADAVWHITSGFSAGLSAQVLLCSDGVLRETILANAARYCAVNRWPEVGKKLLEIYRHLAFVPTRKDIAEPLPAKPRVLGRASLRVLFQNRSNAFSQRGGDTVVMEKTIEGLKKHAVEVQVDLDGRQNPADYDLVHIFNFALPELARAFAERAHRAGVPYIVTTLCEDAPLFHNQSQVHAAALIEYCQRGQSSAWWNVALSQLRGIPVCRPFNNAWTAEHAAALLSNGSRESEVLRSCYPCHQDIFEVKLGCEVSDAGDPQLFEREYGVRDFVLCVGRLESRKNQLMLLKALEESDLPVVLAAGGFSYQPEYEQAVKKFIRKGRTIVLGRISDEMLASAYRAAKVHALPSWYELPGLVSLEAARYGCAVVVTKNGTAPDYFGERAFYCDPADEQSVRTAVLAAHGAPRRTQHSDFATQYTWQKAADETYAIYQRVAKQRSDASQEKTMSEYPNKQTAATSSSMTPAVNARAGEFGGYDMASQAIEFQETLERAELATKSGEFQKAEALFIQAEKLNPQSVRMMRTWGACILAQGDYRRARTLFERALVGDSDDTKALTGLGMCEIMDSQQARAAGRFVAVLGREPGNLVALGQLVECAYATSSFAALEPALRRYVALNPTDVGMLYCLAGCLFRMGDLKQAEEWLMKVEGKEPGRAGLAELRAVIEEAKKAQDVRPAAAAPVQRETIIVSVPEENPMDYMRKADGLLPLNADIETRLAMIEEDKHRRNLVKVKDELAIILTKRGLSAEHEERVNLVRAEVAVLEDELSLATEIYAKVLEKNPRSARGLCGRGALAAHAGDWSSAQRCFEEARAINSNYDVALAGLGLCASIKGDREKAWGLYLRATQINCENLRALLGLIELGYPLDRLLDVKKALEAYLELHPADLEFVYALAGCCYAQGYYQEAMQAVDRIELFSPKHVGAGELRELIRSKVSAPRAMQSERR